MADLPHLWHDVFGYALARWRDERSEASQGFDRQLGVQTARWTLGGYEPTPPALLDEVLAAQPFPDERVLFVDVGAGKGRVLLLAARRPYLRVLGLELDGALVDIGQRNLRRGVDAHRRCHDLTLLHADASDVAWPLEPLVLYLYNPFDAVTLGRMLRAVERSLAQHPRPCALAYVNPLYADVLRARGWVAGAEGGDGTESWGWWQPAR
jgi:SAM-dependent methyltransferase